MRLNDLSIRGLPAPTKGQKTYFDDDLRGFGVRVSQGGAKSFIVMYGTTRRLKTLARYPATSLKDARKLARTFQAGDKPSATRLSITDAITAFLGHCEAKELRPRTIADYRRLLNRHLPTGRLSDITRAGLLERLNRLASVPAEQQHAATGISIFLNWSVAAGYLQTNPLQGIRGIGSVKSRDRVLSTGEVTAVLRAALAHPFPYGHITALALTTGRRKSEISHLHRSYIRDRAMHLPPDVMKNRRPLSVPIGPLTEQIIATIPNMGDILFPGRSDGDGYWNGWSRAKTDFDNKLATVQPYRFHDLRRTFTSVNAELSTPIHVLEKLIGHTSGSFGGVHGVYNRWTYWPEMTEAVSRYEAHLLSLLETA